MKLNKFYIIVAAIIITVGLVFLGLSNRFYIDTSTHLKVDRLTGKTYKLYDSGWKEIKDIYESSVTQTISPIGQTHKEEKEDSTLSQIDNYKEYITNLNRLKMSIQIFNKFEEYYKEVITEYNKDPLFIKNAGIHAVDIKFSMYFEKYSPLLSPESIVKELEEQSIKDPIKFIDCIIEYYQNLKYDK